MHGHIHGYWGQWTIYLISCTEILNVLNKLLTEGVFSAILLVLNLLTLSYDLKLAFALNEKKNPIISNSVPFWWRSLRFQFDQWLKVYLRTGGWVWHDVEGLTSEAVVATPRTFIMGALFERFSGFSERDAMQDVVAAAAEVEGGSTSIPKAPGIR